MRDKQRLEFDAERAYMRVVLCTKKKKNAKAFEGQLA
jgi:hypothetical protein